MMDLYSDFDDSSPRMGMWRAGLGLTAVALGLLCVSDLALFAPLFNMGAAFGAAQNHPVWYWGLGAAIPWASLLGSVLLLAGWSDVGWRRKVGLLVLLNTVDAGLWFGTHAKELGFSDASLAHEWLVFLVTLGSGWFELLLTAQLAERIASQSGDERPAESGGAIRILTALGVMIWALLLLTQTKWAWPLVPIPPIQGHRLNMERELMCLISFLFQMILTFQVAVLCLSVSRRCRVYERHLSEKGDGLHLLKSRSETEQDDTFWT